MSTHLACSLSDLLGDLGAVADVAITSVSQDSRDVQPGGLFLARAGGKAHGLDFIDQVVVSGVAAIAAEPDERWSRQAIEALAQRYGLPIIPVEGLAHRISAIAGAFYGHPSSVMRLVGITGTNGKTSCSHAIAHAMSAKAQTAIIGTLGNGRPDQLVSASHTTPDAVGLQRLLAEFRDQGVELVSMEVSSHALDQGRVEALRFDTAVFTNLSRDHLDYHKTMQAYGDSKARLFHDFIPGAAVINADDPFAETLIAGLPEGVRLAVYGLLPLPASMASADLRLLAESVQTTSTGLRIEVAANGRHGVLESRWLGHFNASNLLAVLAVLLEQGIVFEEALQMIASVPVVSGRMEALGGGERPLVVVDYAHTPDALENALHALRPHCRGRLICLFGCGGDRDRGKRPMMGEVAERLADSVVVTDDNPRSESGDFIVQEILAGMRQPEQVRVERDRAQAIAWAVQEAGPGDVVAICGKGHETTQQIGDTIHPFSDRLKVLEALGEEPVGC